MSNTYISPAKINLTLWVTGRRPDGYHLLDSLVVFSDVADTLTLTLTDDPNQVKLTVDGYYGASLSTGEDNLIIKAIRAIQSYAQETGQPLHHGVHVHLTKKLPVSAGLGGGSSNCAVILNELPLLWGVAITQLDIDAIGQKLGADVMVCLRQATMRMQGIGDILNPIELSTETKGVLLVNTGTPLDTATVFAHYQTQRQQGLLQYSTPEDDWDISPLDAMHMVKSTTNDLQQSAMDLCHTIAPLLQALAQLDTAQCHGMSGSGATCFALFADKATADTAKTTLQSQYPNWWMESGVIL